jgi:PAS domain S-box-containing protein
MAAMMFAVVIASQFAARQEEKEKALALSNERFTLATKGANEGLFDWNLKTGEVFFSDQFKKILGTRLENTPDALKTWLRMVLPVDRRMLREALRRFRRDRTANTLNVEYRVPGAERNRRWLHSKAVAVRDPASGWIVRLVGSISDITQRKQSDVALRASEARFRSITEAHPVPIMIVGLEGGTVLYASPAAEQLLGATQNLLRHEQFARFLTESKAWADIAHAMSLGHEVNLKEVTLLRGDGEALPAALSARRISYQDESAMAIGLYDLSERKLAEAQIARQQEALQQSEKMAALGGLLAGVAHELNNPLSVVLGQATLLMEGTQEQKVSTRAEKIFKAADRCARIVKSFLALARRKEPERKAVELNALVQAALDLLGFQIRTENIEIALALEPNLAEINGDPDQLTQVITNLILNAAQAMQGWAGKRRLTISSWQEDGARVFLSIADTGPGVPPDIRSRIFEPFFTTKGSKGGTGVGLSLCLGMVESHGGLLHLEDTPGGGATFIVELPITQAADRPGPEVAPDKVRLPHLRILLVDDEVEIAQTLADLMEPEGHHIEVMANGALALERLRKASYDVIISDLRMPVLDGPGLHEALQREMPTYLTRIIYVTGDTLSAHVQAFLSEHPIPVIEKPYRLDDVRRAIAAFLQENANGRSMGAGDLTIPPPAQPALQR